MVRRSLVAFALALSVGQAVSVYAAENAVAPAQAAPLAESLTGAAKQAYDAGKLLIQNGDAAGAVAKFTEAYDLSHDARLLFNTAVAEKSIHHYARMQALLRRYITESGGLLGASDRAQVDAALAAIENLVGTLRITVNAEGADVSLDGVKLGVSGTTPLEATIDLGKHTVVVTKAGFTPVEQTFETSGGKEVPLTVRLSPRTAMGKLVIISDEHASISVDGRAAAVGRYEATILAGTHDVLVSERGKNNHSATVDLHDGETRSIEVTLSDEHKVPVWPWVAGGIAVVAGAVVGGYFLLRPRETTTQVSGSLGTISLGNAH